MLSSLYFIETYILFSQGADIEVENFKKNLSEYELAKELAIQGVRVSFFCHLEYF